MSFRKRFIRIVDTLREAEELIEAWTNKYPGHGTVHVWSCNDARKVEGRWVVFPARGVQVEIEWLASDMWESREDV